MAFRRKSVKTGSCTTVVIAHTVISSLLSCSEGSGPSAETPLGRADKSVLHGSNDTVREPIRIQSIKECVGPCTSARLAPCLRRSNYHHSRRKTCPCTCRSRHKVDRGPRYCLLRSLPWSAWSEKGALFGTKVDTWAPEVTLHAHGYALSFIQNVRGLFLGHAVI